MRIDDVEKPVILDVFIKYIYFIIVCIIFFTDQMHYPYDLILSKSSLAKDLKTAFER